MIKKQCFKKVCEEWDIFRYIQTLCILSIWNTKTRVSHFSLSEICVNYSQKYESCLVMVFIVFCLLANKGASILLKAVTLCHPSRRITRFYQHFFLGSAKQLPNASYDGNTLYHKQDFHHNFFYCNFASSSPIGHHYSKAL